MDRTGIITFKGNPMTLQGDQVNVGQQAPEFVVVDNGLKAKKLSDFSADAIVIVSVPSVDTSVCDTEIRKFNEKVAEMGDNVKVLAISMDLPFAQARWCAAAGIENVITVSDYKEKSFAKAFGVLIKELGLLARAIFVIDKQAVIRYIQIVPEIASEPDYQEVVKQVKTLLNE